MPPTSVTVFASDPGNYFFEDDGTPSNNFSRIVFPNGAIIPFEHPTNDLFFTPSVPGVFLTVNFTDSLGAANFTVGNLTDVAQTPDSIVMNRVNTTGIVTLVSNGAISEGDADAGADVAAGTLIMSAATGIGTPGNAIETQAGIFEGETSTGGINVINFGTVQIGGTSGEVSGLNVVDSGNINFTNYGTIVLADETGFESVHGGNISGNVALTAIGFDSDIIANVDQDSISAAGGAINLTAGRDVAFGRFGANFDNDVRASGGVTINAGRDFLIDGFSDLVSDDFLDNTGGNVVINAGRNIGLLNTVGSDASILASGNAGADVILTTGAGGTLTANSGSGAALSASITSNSGDVIVNADRIAIGALGAIAATSGQVILRTATAGRAIDVGSATDAAFAMELSDAELDRIFTPTLTIGSATVGSLTVSAAISPLNAPNLVLQSGEDVTISSAVTITDTLTVRAGDDLFLPVGSSITATVFNGFVDQDGAADAAGGVGTLNGIVSAISTLTGNVNADTLNGSDGANTLNGDAGNDTLRGFGGADTLNGGAGNDDMSGGLGDDIYIVGAAGDTTVENAGEGTDTVRSFINWTLGAEVERLELQGVGNLNGTGNALNNTLVGNSGNNLLNGGAGNDFMVGGAGNDIFVVAAAGDSTIENAGGGTDTVRSFINWTLGANVERLELEGSAANGTGNALANTLVGNGLANVMNGGDGNDFIITGAGNDTLNGGNQNDTLVGGAGADTMNGGAGNDTFLYQLLSDTGVGLGNRDAINSFVHGQDLINLAALDANAGVGGNQAFSFIGAAGFSGVAGQLRYSAFGNTCLVDGDVNGDSVADFQIAVAGTNFMTSTDFIL